MKHSNLHIFGILILALAGGCATPTQPVPPNPQVSYTQNATYNYLDNVRDTTDKPVSSTTDTVTSTVIGTNTTYLGMSNVTIIRNAHTNGSVPDTTYISQNNGDFWHYNYGLEAINNNSSITSQIGGPVEIGWVLQAKFNAVAGDKWVAANDNSLWITVPTLGKVNAAVVDNAVEQSDTLITINGSNVFSKHILHTVTLTALGDPLVNTVDAYVASSVGVTLNIVHRTNVNITGVYRGPVKGSQSLMIKHS
jgi:hypothetical protein